MSHGNYAPFYRSGFFNPIQQVPQFSQMQVPQSTPNIMDNSNSFMPQSYQPMPPQQPAMPYAVQNQPTNDFIWVQGEAGAKAYLIAPNATVTLWDSESPTIYIKSADANGIPSMRTLDFTERTENAQKPSVEHVCKCGDKFIPKEDFNALQAQFNAIEGKLNDLENKYNTLINKKTNKSTKGEDE